MAKYLPLKHFSSSLFVYLLRILKGALDIADTSFGTY